MARIIVNGSKVQIASGYATAFALTNISNAATAVVTCGTAHGVGSGDYFEITHCDWSRLAGRAFRAQATSATTITVEGLDTSSTAIYPAGTITGTAKEVQVALAAVTSIGSRTVQIAPVAVERPQFILDTDQPVARRLLLYRIAPLFTSSADPTSLS